MTDTRFDFADPRAQEIWAPDTFEYALQAQRLYPLMGSDGMSIIHVNKDLTRGPGGEIVFESWNKLTGAGQGDGGTTLGNEQALTARNMTVRVHTRQTATRAEGMLALQITSLRGVEKFRMKSREELATWMEEQFENDLITTASGLYNENASSADIETINEAYPTSTRIIYLGQSVGSSPALDNSGTSFATDALLSAATSTDNLFGTLVINKLRSMALMAAPKMRPGNFYQTPASVEQTVQFEAKPEALVGRHYVILASPYQFESIRSELGNNGFNQAVQNAGVRGADNPIFSGGSFLWNGILCVEYERVPYRTGAGGTTLAEGFLLNAGRTATTDAVASGATIARGCLLGAQGLAWGWALPPGWWEEMYDANKPRVKTEMLYGCKRTQFNAHGGSTPGAEEAIINFDTHIVL